MRPILIAAVLCIIVPRVSSQEKAAGVRAECFIEARPGARPYVSDEQECRRATVPASTFKIPHALIALDTGVVTRDTIFKWDGRKYTNDSWHRDHTLTTAIRWSVLPFFQHTARQIGRERMRRGLAMLHYAEDTFDGDIDAFWLNGDLVVSPREQFAFLSRFVRGTLPISRAHLSTVLEAMRMPQGEVLMAAGAHPFELTWPAGTVVRAKTGNATVAGERVSWLIGSLELESRQHVFVARLRFAGTLPPSAGADLALRELNTRTPR
jgi:beta-lactamase class D